MQVSSEALWRIFVTLQFRQEGADLGEQLLCPPSPAISELFRSRTVRGYGTSHA